MFTKTNLKMALIALGAVAIAYRIEPVKEFITADRGLFG